jgi:tRNA (mo5U34)-methyltransferase
MTFANLEPRVPEFSSNLEKTKEKLSPDFPWYPYSTMPNISHLKPLFSEQTLDFTGTKLSIADIGCADGALAFFMERQGHHVDAYDFGPTNMNGMRGVKALKTALESQIGIYEMDLDSQFNVQKKYDFIFLLGILYHLKNPFYVLEKLSKHTKYCAISTRTIQVPTRFGPNVERYALAYLADPTESNNDATNFWFFTVPGIHRCAERAGWNVVSSITLGENISANPQDPDKDQRTFSLLKSRL